MGPREFDLGEVFLKRVLIATSLPSQQELKRRIFADFGRSVRYNLDGFPDISETEVQRIRVRG